MILISCMISCMILISCMISRVRVQMLLQRGGGGEGGVERVKGEGGRLRLGGEGMGSGAEGCSAIGAALILFVHVGVAHRTCFMQLVPMCPENCARNLADNSG